MTQFLRRLSLYGQLIIKNKLTSSDFVFCQNQQHKANTNLITIIMTIQSTNHIILYSSISQDSTSNKRIRHILLCLQ